MAKQTTKKILLVEDDPFLHKVLKQRLEKETGYTVLVATDGEDAIRQIKEHKPTLVLLDLIIPKKNGFEVLEELRGMTGAKKLPVVVLSNLGQQEDLEQVKKLGVVDYMVKADFSLSQMVEKIKKHAESAK